MKEETNSIEQNTGATKQATLAYRFFNSVYFSGIMVILVITASVVVLIDSANFLLETYEICTTVAIMMACSPVFIIELILYRWLSKK